MEKSRKYLVTFFFSPEIPPSLQDPACVCSLWGFFSTAVLPSPLPPSNNLTAPTGWRAFLTFCRLTLSYPQHARHPHDRQIIHKQMILPRRNVLFHLIYAAILSRFFGTERHARIQQTYLFFNSSKKQY